MTIKEFYEKEISNYQKGREKIVQVLSWLKTDDDKLEQKTLAIGQIESRDKTFDSFYGKCLSKQIVKSLDEDVDPEKINAEIRDIAGVRVICVYVDYIPNIVKALRNAPGITIKRVKNYIEHPELKPNGYRALHLETNVEVPDIIEGNVLVPVEIQIRTFLQHVWAVAEHAILYKPEAVMSEQQKAALGSYFVALGAQFALIDASLVIARDCARTREETFDPIDHMEMLNLRGFMPDLQNFSDTDFGLLRPLDILPL